MLVHSLQVMIPVTKKMLMIELKTRSAAANQGCSNRTNLQASDQVGNFSSCVFHQLRGSTWSEISSASAKYLGNSFFKSPIRLGVIKGKTESVSRSVADGFSSFTFVGEK